MNEHRLGRYARRRPGKCEDCGQGPVRTIRFWLNDMRYRVCQQHEREYRDRICWPVLAKNQPDR